jgi:hypothetical protein
MSESMNNIGSAPSWRALESIALRATSMVEQPPLAVG